MIIPRHYENLKIMHENTMPYRSYYIPASSYAISYDLNSNLVHEINGTINSSKLIKK